eukprot:CAMPEP_0178702834 /NCGR_PEP_ID=MMETSP0699-20121125/13149_1 /TAXON_ID=265572 /ORGANISM="Extubocellulus spinifer, Strain CCMP396" /LENGTH=303 /DNA_ID=CAMNT_0020349723 /DNA_START=637 /DNA_END=1548 /DNA_ORIENTATION=+
MSSLTSLTEEQQPFFPVFPAWKDKKGGPSELACLALGVVGAFVIIALSQIPFIVPPGEVGVVVTMGHVHSYTSGLHYRFPLISKTMLMTAKIQILDTTNIVPTREGLAVTLDTAVLFRLNSTHVSQLYKDIGPDYVQLLIEPEAASAVRGLTSESEAKALYSSGRSMIQDTVKAELTEKLSHRGILIEDVLLKDIHLPSELSKSIEAKVQAEQDADRMQFVLVKEKQEAERKSIEAKGISDFQKIVSEGISPELLKWKGIEATQDFASSPNTKIVMIGNSENDLPVILSATDPEPVPAPVPAP